VENWRSPLESTQRSSQIANSNLKIDDELLIMALDTQSIAAERKAIARYA
jgi:hypothetical protein